MQNSELTSERIVVTGRGSIELQTWSVPPPGPGELRLRVAYSAVSFGDLMLRRHVFRKRPPITVPGYEVVATVEAVGAGVSGIAPGQRVACFIEYGGNARHAIARAEDAVVLPDQVDDVLAAATVLNYASALGMFEAGRLQAGDDFLVQGATGGVGSAVLDAARAFGLRAFGTTRGDTSRELFGARLFSTHSPTLVDDVRRASSGGVRAVFDSRAGRGLWRSRAMLARGGSLVVFGLSSVAEPGLGAIFGSIGSLASLALFRALPGKQSRVFAMDQTYHRSRRQVRVWVQGAIDLLAAGTITPLVSDVVPLSRTNAAQLALEAGKVVGKLVIDCR